MSLSRLEAVLEGIPRMGEPLVIGGPDG